MANREELEQKTKEELLEEARERDLEGRSSMNKEELVDALANDSSSDSSGDGSVSEGGDEVRDAQDLLTPTGPDRGHLQSEAEAKLSAGNPTPGEESEDGGSQGADERKAAIEEDNPESAELAAEEMDFSGPLHLQAPEERIMTGAVSEEQAKEQEELLKNKPDDYVGNVTEAGFDSDGNLVDGRATAPAPLVEVVDEEAADTVGKESRGERRERQGIDPDAGESLHELKDNAEARREGDRKREDSTPDGESSSEGNEVS